MAHVLRPPGDFHQVKRLLADGLSDYEVARQTGIPRSTVFHWRRRTRPPRAGRPNFPEAPESWRPSNPERFCYLLGLYLGDGCITLAPRGAPRLVISLDRRYPGIVSEAATAIAGAAPGARVCRVPARGAIQLAASHPIWIIAFPQHGPGRKHTRKIELVNWQSALARQHPKALIRGLIHSDGSRCINRFQVALPSGRLGRYEYVRYFFTNYSADIRRIFCEHCEMLGIRWTQSSFKDISIANRRSVAILDSFVGQKR